MTSNTRGVTIVGNTFSSSLSVLNNMGGATVTGNKVTGNLEVLRNTGTVPPTVLGLSVKSKLQ